MIAQGRGNEKKIVLTRGESYRHATTINMLPDVVLLEIFDFYRDTLNLSLYELHLHWEVWRWPLLAHVCQKWRQLMFVSPRRLNLRILCTSKTPVTKNLHVWPAFPIVIDYPNWFIEDVISPDDEDNVIAALEHPDRVCYLSLNVTSSQLGKVAAVMQEPFLVLTYLYISSDGNAPVLPTEFLGGSAPCLQKIHLHGTPCPALPTLLLSTSDLVELDLRKISPTGYVSPEAMVASLAVLPRLEILVIEFQSATPRPERRRSPPVTRTVLPALTYFRFGGASEYLEALIAPMDGPQLNDISIKYLNQFNLQVAEFSKFIGRSGAAESTPFKHAHVTFLSNCVTFDMYDINYPDWARRCVRTIISCEGIDFRVSHMARLFSQFSVILSNVIYLKLDAETKEAIELEVTDDAEWLHFLHQFSAVKTLHVSPELAELIALALEVTVEMVTGALSSVDLIYLVGLPAPYLESFAAARRLSDRPVTIVDTETEFDKRFHS